MCGTHTSAIMSGRWSAASTERPTHSADSATGGAVIVALLDQAKANEESNWSARSRVSVCYGASARPLHAKAARSCATTVDDGFHSTGSTFSTTSHQDNIPIADSVAATRKAPTKEPLQSTTMPVTMGAAIPDRLPTMF